MGDATVTSESCEVYSRGTGSENVSVFPDEEELSTFTAVSPDQQAQGSENQHEPFWLAVNLMLRLKFMFSSQEFLAKEEMYCLLFSFLKVFCYNLPIAEMNYIAGFILSFAFHSSQVVQISWNVDVSLYSVYQ